MNGDNIFYKIVIIFTLAPLIGVAALLWITAFQPYEQTCESAMVVDKRFTGEYNNIPTIFASHNGSVIDGHTDNDTFYGVEIGDEVNYCFPTSVWLPIMTHFERIER